MRVLLFAPHNDDETLGAGGTLARLCAEGHEVFVCEVTGFPDDPLSQAVKAEARRAHALLGVQTIFMDLPVVGLKEMPTTDKNRAFCKVVEQVKPELAFIPHRGDLHVDHAETAAAAMVALRPLENPQLRAVLSYETLSETEWNAPGADTVFLPQIYCDITDYMKTKLQAMACYKTQLRPAPHPRSLEALAALAQLRGSAAGLARAECFMLLRGVIGREALL